MLNMKYSQRHGGPWDRGSADSYYRRAFDPHYFVGATYSSKRIEQDEMTTDEMMAYEAGFNDNESSGNFKY